MARRRTRDVVLYAVHDLKPGGLDKTGSFSLFHFFFGKKKKKVLPSANARPLRRNAEGNEVFQRASSYATGVRNVAVNQSIPFIESLLT